MKYFILKHNGLNLKETGTQFQSIDGILGDIQQDFIPFEGKFNFAFKLPEPFLEKKAKPTTYLHTMIIPSWFLVFKNYFIDFLKGYNIRDFQTWNIKVHQNNNSTIDDYILFYLTETLNSEIIDLEKSKFSIGKWGNWEYHGDNIFFKTKSDYEKKWDELSNTDNYIKSPNLYLDFSLMKLDLFRVYKVPIIGGHHLISEKLKNAIEKEGFTGFVFQEIEEMDDRIKCIY